MKPRGARLSFASDTGVMAVLFAGGVIAFVVVFVVLLSNASFTESTSSKGNRFDAGTAGIKLSTQGAIVDATNIGPGETRSGDVEATNTGEPAFVSVTVKGAPASSPLATVLRLKIAPRGSPGGAVFDGTLASAGRIQLGTHAAGASSAWTFSLTLPAGADPALGGTALEASFEWEARTQ